MRTVRTLTALAGLGLGTMAWLGQTHEAAVVTNPLNSLRGIEVVNGKGEIATYRGRRALHFIPLPGNAANDASVLGMVTGIDFRNGTVEVDVAGVPAAGAPEDSRGFIGLVFRAQEHGARGENIYLRPT